MGNKWENYQKNGNIMGTNDPKRENDEFLKIKILGVKHGPNPQVMIPNDEQIFQGFETRPCIR